MGVAATLVVGAAVRRVGSAPKDTTANKSRDMVFNDSSGSGNTREMQSTDLMDSPDLDLRLIRKAEAVIQIRLGNLIVVIERSTNSWNKVLV
eukprot:scaffold8374_cov175-Amphora_coffeaeformis.AAC.53